MTLLRDPQLIRIISTLLAPRPPENHRRPELFTIHTDTDGHHDYLPITDHLPDGPDLAAALRHLANRARHGHPAGVGADGARGLLLVHREVHGPPGNPTIYRLADVADLAGDSLRASRNQWQDGPVITITADGQEIGPIGAALLDLLAAITGGPAPPTPPNPDCGSSSAVDISDDGDLTAAWATLAGAPTANTDVPAVTAAGGRGLLFARLIEGLAGQQHATVCWDEAPIAAATDTAAVQAWLGDAAQLAALDLTQMLLAAAYDSLHDIDGTPIGCLTEHAVDIAQIADAWLATAEIRDTTGAGFLRRGHTLGILEPDPDNSAGTRLPRKDTANPPRPEPEASRTSEAER